jgi:hypothetical protein
MTITPSRNSFGIANKKTNMATSTEIDPTTPQGEVRKPMFAVEPAVFSAGESIEAEMVEITYRLNLLRLATREEIEATIKTTRVRKAGESAPRFLLTLFADERELKVTDIEAAIAGRNIEASRKRLTAWTSQLKMMKTNANATITRNTGLEFRERRGRNGGTWRLESQKVQEESAIPADKRDHFTASAKTRHEKVLEIAAKTEDKKTKCLLQLVAQQTAGVRLAEIVEVFDGTLTVKELIEFIGTTNNETLAPIDAKIHLRNGIAIIGPRNPHWESSTGEPILVNNLDSIYGLATRNRQGFSAKIKAVLINKETQEQTIARLTEENSRLQTAVDRLEKDVEEALRLAQEAHAEKETLTANAEKEIAKIRSTTEEAVRDLTAKLATEEARAKDLSARLQEVSRGLLNTRKLLEKAQRNAELAEEARVEAKRSAERLSTMSTRGQSEEIARLERALGNTITRARDAEDRSATQADPKELANLRQQASEAATLRSQIEASRTRIQTLEARILELEARPKEPAKPAETETLKTRIADLEGTNKELQTMLDATKAPSVAQIDQQKLENLRTRVQKFEAQIKDLQKENAGLQEMLESATSPAAATTDSLSITQPTHITTATQPTTATTHETSQPPKPKPPESPSPIKDLEDAKIFKNPEDLYKAVDQAVTFGSTLHPKGMPKGMPKGTHRRIKNALRSLRNLPSLVESARTRLLKLLEDMKGQGDVIPHEEIKRFLESTIG